MNSGSADQGAQPWVDMLHQGLCASDGISSGVDQKAGRSTQQEETKWTQRRGRREEENKVWVSTESKYEI